MAGIVINGNNIKAVSLNGQSVTKITEGGVVLWDKMTHIDYLCFTDASGSSNTLTLTNNNGLASPITLEYSTDKVNWTTWTESNNVRTYTIPANGKVYLRGDNATFNSKTDANTYRFSSSGNINASGDLTTLLNKFATETLPEGAFNMLFNGMTTLKSVPKLIATTLGEKCYANLFFGCTGLTDASSISIGVTNLPLGAFASMFYNCSNLTTPPTFTSSPLTITLNTFANMFYGCTSLTTAPSFTISAINGTGACHSMFKGCTSLTSASNITLNATTIPNSAYEQMFNECSALVSAPTITSSALTIGDRGLQQLFRNCTSLTTAPNLNITTLDSTGIRHCYDLFRGCSALTDVTKVKLNATTLYNQSYHSVFNGCTSLVTPPEIMATTYFSDSSSNTNGSFVEMFYNCSKLSTIKVHFTTWQNNGRGTKNWTYGTKSSGTFYKPSSLPSTKNASGNTTNPDYIPYNWTVTNI